MTGPVNENERSVGNMYIHHGDSIDDEEEEEVGDIGDRFEPVKSSSRGMSFEQSVSVADRIRKFRELGKAKPMPELSNTGKHNPALSKRRAEEEEEARRRAEMLAASRGNRGKFLTAKQKKKFAAMKVQSIIRMKLAKKEADKLRDKKSREAYVKEKANAATKVQSVMRTKLARNKLNQLRYQQELDRKNKAAQLQRQRENIAATKLQALVRSVQTRDKLLQLLDQMIYEEQASQQRELEAAIKLQSMVRSAMARVRVRKLVEAMIADLLAQRDEEARIAAEQQRVKEEQEALAAMERARLIAEEEERQRLAAKRGMKLDRGRLPLFIGPLQDEVGLIPEWWMDYVPHRTLPQDEFVAYETDWMQYRVRTMPPL